MSARVYFMKRVKDCKNVSIMYPQMNNSVLFVYCNFHVFLSTTVCSQNINKQNVNMADETYRFRICHWIPMFIGTPCINTFLFSLSIFLTKPVLMSMGRFETSRFLCLKCFAKIEILNKLQNYILVEFWFH